MEKQLEPNEIWLDVKDFEDFYQVSSLGRFKSKERTISSVGKKSYIKKSIILKPLFYSNGYNQLMLYKNKKRYTFIAHRVIAEHFIENILNHKEVNHINSIKNDNRISNLEWCSPSENIQKALFFNPNFGKNRGVNSSRLKELDVINIKKMILNNVKINDIISKYKISKATYFNLKSNKTWAHIIIN